jgi:regulator of nonsense transcripts 3
MSNINGTNAPAILKKPAASSSNTGRFPRANQPRLKIVIRRLPPGLTEAEFISSLGTDWAVSNGQIDWFEFHPGKVSKDLRKPSRAATAHMRLTETALIAKLGEHLKQMAFLDAKSTFKDPSLLGPPIAEFAPNQKVPQPRNKVDARQGTIDTDPEFIKFLESLTDPIQKPNVDLEASLHREENKITTTPLIEHLREKKAAKDKPKSASAKESREQRRRKRKEAHAATASASESSVKEDRSGKEGIKIMSRQSGAAKSSEKEKSVVSSSERRREREPLGIAAKIQRDLGIGAATRRGSRGVKAGESSASSALPTSSKDASSSSATRRDGRNRDRDRRAKADTAVEPKLIQVPIILKKQPDSSTSAASAGAAPPIAPAAIIAARQTSAPPTEPSAASRRAFLKHANPSQGITEPLLEAALTKFGTVLKVEIDRKKGTAWAEFENSAALTAAIKAGKVDVANGAVQVSGYRERAPKPAGPAGPAQQQASANRRGTRGRGRPIKTAAGVTVLGNASGGKASGETSSSKS